MNRTAILGALAVAGLACDAPTETPPTTPPAAQTCATAPASPLALQIGAEKASAIQQAMQLGIVVVAFDCTEIVVLDSCSIDGGYELVARPRVDVDKRFTSRAEVEAASPLWGTSTPPLHIEPGEVLELKLVTVGQERATKDRAAKTDLQGTCGGATHFVRAVHVGAFELTGTRAGGGHEAKAGSLQECPTDTQRPSAQCRAPLQLELVPIAP